MKIVQNNFGSKRRIFNLPAWRKLLVLSLWSKNGGDLRSRRERVDRMNFFFVCFSGEHETSASRTRNARGVEREEKVVLTLSRVSSMALTQRLLLLAWKIQSKKKSIGQLKKYACSKCEIKDCNCYFGQDKVREFWRALFKGSHVYFKTEIINTECIVQIKREISLVKGGEIRDTKTLNLSRNIVSLQVLVDVSRFSPCMINLWRHKNICCRLKKFVAKSRAQVYFKQQMLALLLVLHQTHNLLRNKFTHARIWLASRSHMVTSEQVPGVNKHGGRFAGKIFPPKAIFLQRPKRWILY